MSLRLEKADAFLEDFATQAGTCGRMATMRLGGFKSLLILS